MGDAMFCFQCEQTAGGKGCTKLGVCGKDPKVAALQDLLIYELKGIGFWAQRLIEKGTEVNTVVKKFVMDAIFWQIQVQPKEFWHNRRNPPAS